MEKDPNESEIESSIDVEETAPLNNAKFFRTKPQQRRHHAQDLGLSFALGAVIAITISFAISYFTSSTHSRHLPAMLPGTDAHTGKPSSWFNGDCGASRQEAISRGCRFDRILHSWLPPACVHKEDLEDEEEFLNTEDWRYYSDPKGTPLTAIETYEGDYDVVFTSWRWHLVHCTYVWRKLHRAYLDGRNVDSYIANLNHTMHCSHALLMEGDSSKRLTRIFRKFPTCG